MAKKKAAPGKAEGEDGAAPASGSKKKYAALAAVLLLAGAGGGVFFWKKSAHADAHGSAHAATHADPHGEAGAGKDAGKDAGKRAVAFLDVRDMVVNLTAELGKPKGNLLRLRVALELKDAGVEQEVKPLLPRVEDAFQVYMRELRPSDLAGSAGLYRLREELLRRVNIALYPAKAEAVLFKDVVVQEQ